MNSTLKIISSFILMVFCIETYAQETRLLRQPDIHQDQIVFSYGSDIWTCKTDGSQLVRITSTSAVESYPHFSPDGQTIAFSSNRSGNQAVYTVSVNGGIPDRLTWYPSNAAVRGWSPDGSSILYASSRGTAPSSYNRLWTVNAAGGPSTLLNKQWGYDGSYSEDGNLLALDKMSRWDVEWRNYRGGQNSPLIILNLETNEEELLPNDKTVDIKPVFVGESVYFLSDRDWIMNIWKYDLSSKSLTQITNYKETDIKWLNSDGEKLIFEHNGYLHNYNITSGSTEKLTVNIQADFPWVESKWEDVSSRVRNASLSSTGKRILIEARGEVFTVPVKHGKTRNITKSSGAADREPLWSPKGDQIAFFSDRGNGEYRLYFKSQDGRDELKNFSISPSKFAWNPSWSPDGKYIAFTDDDVRIRYINVENGEIIDVDTGGNNLDRSRTGLEWSHDSKNLAYVKSGDNFFRQIWVYNTKDQSKNQLTNSFADSFSPAWDRDNKHLYFLASTDLALASGWANTSSMQADPEYSVYAIVLDNEGKSPFIPRSDEEEVEEEEEEEENENENEDGDAESEEEGESTEDNEDGLEEGDEDEEETVKIDYDRLDRRTISLPFESANYLSINAGPAGSFFVGELIEGEWTITLHKFSLENREHKPFSEGIDQYTISPDGNQILLFSRGAWKIGGTVGPDAGGAKPVKVKLNMKLDRLEEWNQMFEEAWRYERDFFYDPNIHGRDWNKVYQRYQPLVAHIRHRADLSYILDQVNGELSVGHSFVFGGDFPRTERSKIGVLGADLELHENRWRIKRIYTNEDWNPRLSSPLDRPGIKVKEGQYLVGINGTELDGSIDPYELLDGTRGEQTSIHINDKPSFMEAWEETIEPISSEFSLRQKAWVEDNRRMVDSLSGGRLAYVWVPNTGGSGFVNFNRYFFAQQHKEGAVIDERFNGGGLLDDYMVDLMTRSLRAAITNEVPEGKPFRLPAGILGPKVLLINERAGSGGDFFPWVFRQQKAGLLIGETTWGGLVKSSVHYSLVDGGALTSPDNAVFDPINNKYIGENEGIAPDIQVRMDAKSMANDEDPQIRRAVEELLKQLRQNPQTKFDNPPYNTPAKQK